MAAAGAPAAATASATAGHASAPTSTMLTTEAPQIIEHVQHSLTYTPTDVRWVPSSAKFIALGEKPRGTGALQVFELDVGKARLVHEVSLAALRSQRFVPPPQHEATKP